MAQVTYSNEFLFGRFVTSLDAEVRPMVREAIEVVLKRPSVGGRWLKEFPHAIHQVRLGPTRRHVRYLISPAYPTQPDDRVELLLRIYCHKNDGDWIVLSGFDKAADRSRTNQQREFENAIAELTAFKARQRMGFDT